MCKISSSRVDVIFDRQFIPSINDTNKCINGSIERDFKIIESNQVRPSDFAKEMKNSKFREALINFFLNHWQECNYNILGLKIININFDGWYELKVYNQKIQQTLIEELSCDGHEKITTKIIYHVCCINSDLNVVIRSCDADALVIMLGNIERLQSSLKIWLDFGTGNSRRYIDIMKIYENVGPVL